MNIFATNLNPYKAAAVQIDKHVVKMCVESLQMISAIMHLLGINAPYKSVMLNHPCTIWTRSSLDNYEWTWCYAHALAEEFRYRYGKEHKSFWQVINKLPDPINIERVGFTTFGLAMPDILKNYDDPIQSYRDYYHLDKATFASWSHRPTPPWWDESLADYEQRITAK